MSDRDRDPRAAPRVAIIARQGKFLVAEPFFLMDARPSRAERQRRVAEVLAQVGLAPADAERLPHEFS